MVGHMQRTGRKLKSRSTCLHIHAPEHVFLVVFNGAAAGSQPRQAGRQLGKRKQSQQTDQKSSSLQIFSFPSAWTSTAGQKLYVCVSAVKKA